MAQDNHERAGHLEKLAADLDKSYDQTGDSGDLQQAILYGKEAVAEIPLDHSDRPDFLYSMYVRLNKRYARMGDFDDLEQAIFYNKETIEATEGLPVQAQHLSNLAVFLSKRYSRTGDLNDIEQAIFYAEVSVATAPEGDPEDRASSCHKLSMLIGMKQSRTGDLEDIKQAIFYAKEAVEATPQSNISARSSRLSNLASFLGRKYGTWWDLDDLQQAILYIEEAMALMPPDHPERFGFLVNLIASLYQRYHCTKDHKDLQRAISYAKGALEVMPKDHPERVLQLSALAKSLLAEFRRTGDIENLLQAIPYSKDLIAETPLDHPTRFQRLIDLATLFAEKHGETGDEEDFQQALLYSERAAEIRSRGHIQASQLEHMGMLALLLRQKYERTGDLDYLERAVSCAEAVVASSPKDYPGRAEYLATATILLGQMYQRTGDMDILQRAILYGEEAVATDPRSNPHFDRASCLSKLAIPLGLKYDRTGDLDDLQRSILYAKEAVAETEREDPERPGRLVNLAISLNMRYIRMSDLDDLQQTIVYGEEAVELTPLNDPQRISRILNVANALSMRYQETGDLADISRAISSSKDALKQMPHDRFERSTCLSNLATFLEVRYRRSVDKDGPEFQEAISFAEEAASAMPKDHPNRGGALHNLGLMLQLRISDVNDLDKVIRVFREAWECHNSPPSIRIKAARDAAKCLSSIEKWEESSSLLEESIKMLPQVSLRSLEGKDKQHILLGMNGLAADAASMALQAGKSAYHALKLLELSRGIIMGSTIDCRGDISDLKEKYPEPFKKFNSLRTEIDTPLPERRSDLMANTKPAPFHAEAEYLQARNHTLRRREKAISEMEEVLLDIRKLPGCEGFQLPPSENDLKSWVKDGPVVTFISSPTRSDAIIVTSSTITSIPLPDLKFDQIPGRLAAIFDKPPKKTSKKQVKKSSAAAMREYAERNKEMRGMLLWLWSTAVKPVLQKLDLIDENGSPKGTKLAHIWWIGVGRLSVAPFHAAGDHSRGSTENTLSYAISSYTPTIKALSYAREGELDILSKPDSRLLLVTMSKTPGGMDLSDVEQEVDGILSATKGLISTKKLAQPSADDVLKQFGSFHAMHFACHGVSDSSDPSNSHLMLQKNAAVADELTVNDISRKNIKMAQIAYLSACSTAYNPAVLLADEMIHIASGFQLAGFNHVLATMWPAESDVCKEIAIDFYRFLFDGKDSDEGHLKVGRAFHQAVLKARDKNPLLPRKWAPFIHMGA